MNKSESQGLNLQPLIKRLDRSGADLSSRLPESAIARLRNMVAELRTKMQQRKLVGQMILFTGSGGTGKTLSAQLVAHELGLDLFRIDCSELLSRYVGETEKNLSKIFAAASDREVILFFDEADSLFGKRTDVKDSHDRYANVESNYLLRQAKTHRGVVILACSRGLAIRPSAIEIEVSSSDQ